MFGPTVWLVSTARREESSWSSVSYGVFLGRAGSEVTVIQLEARGRERGRRQEAEAGRYG